MATPKTVRTYDLNGTQKEFDITFEYLARSFVAVTLIGTDRKTMVLNTDFRFVTATRIATMRAAAWGPSDGYEMIEIRRFTSAEDRLVDFADGSILRAYDLNISQVQSLHIAEEARDLTADTIAVNEDGDLDARGKRIVNLADATAPDHAVTLRQEQSWAASTLSNKEASEAAAISANASKVAAASSASSASGSATAANASKVAAEAAAEFAEDTITAINDQVSVATAKAGEASASASTATAKAGEASASASTATSAKNTAVIAAQDASAAGLQMGMSMWGYRPQPFAGFALDDGQELDRSLYPSFAAMLDSGLLPVVSEATWQADPTKRGNFVATSSTGKFRMRDLNGVQSGSIVGLFQRGGTSSTPVVRADQIQAHSHEVNLNGAPHGHSLGTGPSAAGKSTITSGLSGFTGNGVLSGPVYGANAGAETAPKQVTGAWMTRLFGIITPLGSAEANSLATSYASLASRISVLENSHYEWRTEVLWTGSVGTAGATITLNRPLTVGEMLMARYNNSGNDHSAVTFITQVAEYIRVPFNASLYAGGYFTMTANPSVWTLTSVTSGYGFASVMALRSVRVP